MSALQIECTSAEWWGDRWAGKWPHSIEANITPVTDGLPNAPVTIYVLTADTKEAVRLLRLAADMLERSPEMCGQLVDYRASNGEVML